MSTVETIPATADATAPSSVKARRPRHRVPETVGQALYDLTKPRITRLVSITAGVGFALGAIGHTWSTTELLWRAIVCVIGTAFSSSGANALNMWWERDRDAVMPRTCQRPLPLRMLSPRVALLVGLLCSAVGVSLLLAIGLAPAIVSLSTILIYVLIYTPMKPLTTVNTLVGAVPGALPPLIGWTAAASLGASSAFGTSGSLAAWADLSSLLQLGGWSLFLLMFVWQIPHSLALTWIYREDYARGGYQMLPISDPTGRITASTILIWSILQLPATIAPVLFTGVLGPLSLGVALVTGVAYIALCVRLARSQSVKHARSVFLASILHLPLLLLVMVADALLRVVIG
jgi:protoheme IX farnesyltransferase